MKIAVDLMGGVGAGDQNMVACHAYPSPEELVLFGDPAKLDSAGLKYLTTRGTLFVGAQHSLSGVESPRVLLKHTLKTSLAQCLAQLAHGQVDAVVSSADTKAIMVLGRHLVGTMNTLRRPAIAKAFQGPLGQFYLLDLGANVECPPALLQQFARLGSALYQSHEDGVDQRTSPRVALLNIGIEAGKGKADINIAADLIANDARLNGVGFLEPSDLFAGKADVIVCDGYAGNLVLKTIESMASYLGNELKQLSSGQAEMQNLATSIDPDRYNGALFAGLKHVVVKSHGSASARGFLSALIQGRDYVRAQLPDACQDMLAK